VLALARVAEGGRVIGVEPSTTVGELLVDVLGLDGGQTRTERPELHSPDAAKVIRVLDAARGTRLYIPVALAASTGLRRGELLALCW
jgi:integrase